MNRTTFRIGIVVSGIYLFVVAATIVWALINDGDASLGFLIPFLVTMPLSWLFASFLPLGYAGLGIAAIIQGVILYFVVTTLSDFVFSFTANKTH